MTAGDDERSTAAAPGAPARRAAPSADAGERQSLNRRWLFIRYVLLDFAALARRGLRSFRLRGLSPTIALVRRRLLPPRRAPLPLALYGDTTPAPAFAGCAA